MNIHVVTKEKRLIEYMPEFFDYCKTEREFSTKSIENYKRFLKPFTIWLQASKLTNLRPSELLFTHTQSFKDYLSSGQVNHSGVGKTLSNRTKNLYLIGLRTFLFYFIEKDIPSISPYKIKLFKEEKSLPQYPTAEVLGKILSAPDTTTSNGLRDKTLLEVLFSTGIKVSQLTSLNRDNIRSESDTLVLTIDDWNNGKSPILINRLPEESSFWLKKYLDTRGDDKERALFINYRSKKGAPRRLTARSIQKMIKKYAQGLDIHFEITPEILRIARLHRLETEERQIEISEQIFTHKVVGGFSPNRLKEIANDEVFYKTSSYSWHLIEQNIEKEIRWLRETISAMPENYRKKSYFINCDDCLFRKIAVLIVSGKINVAEFIGQDNEYLWKINDRQESFSKHGREWHSKLTDEVKRYFESAKFETLYQPTMSHGRADLGIRPRSDKPIYIEIGTISLFKLWYNLLTMKGIIILLIPSEKHMVGFETQIK